MHLAHAFSHRNIPHTGIKTVPPMKFTHLMLPTQPSHMKHILDHFIAAKHRPHSLYLHPYPYSYLCLSIHKSSFLHVHTHKYAMPVPCIWGLPGSSTDKESTCNVGDPASIPGLGRSPGERIGYPLQYSWAFLVVQMVKKSACSAEDLGLIPGLGRSPGGWHGNPL